MAEEKNIHPEIDLNEQMQVRLDKMHKIEEKGLLNIAHY